MTTNTFRRLQLSAPNRPLTADAAAGHAVPFRTAAEAWFWTMGALRARRESSGLGTGGVRRPCDPDDVVMCLDRLYRAGRIDLRHARILRIWGERQLAPDGHHHAERDEARVWNEALTRLEWPLRVKGIIK
jgi:hypothetical protein